jgi:hypothetical protein
MAVCVGQALRERRGRQANDLHVWVVLDELGGLGTLGMAVVN